ncbi:MAG: hypothetical protein KBD22_03185 [Candidatus Pacebacteria bacterium]|nr:hypothetical protein [Candidatus Paceibacterota bacterium]
MEFLPNELKEKFNEMTPEEQADFLQKRNEALKIASAGTKVFEEGSGGALMDTTEVGLEEMEARKDQRGDNQQ